MTSPFSKGGKFWPKENQTFKTDADYISKDRRLEIENEKQWREEAVEMFNKKYPPLKGNEYTEYRKVTSFWFYFTHRCFFNFPMRGTGEQSIGIANDPRQYQCKDWEKLGLVERCPVTWFNKPTNFYRLTIKGIRWLRAMA